MKLAAFRSVGPPRALTDTIAGKLQANDARKRFADRLRDVGLAAPDDVVEIGAVLSVAYPALARSIDARPADVVALARGTKQARDARAYRKAALPFVGDLSDSANVRRGLRLFAARERLRIAARELFHADADVDTTARELSDLADVCIDVALAEARVLAEARFGVPRTLSGERCALVVLGMGKLGGRELNAGSDVDLLLFYETDDGAVWKGDRAAEISLHEYFTRVAQTMTQTLDDVTEDGFVWRVDLRLRPEGSRGALVNSLAAAERYYETWGRTWERAALVRARPVAGDVALGKVVLDALAPFVWRRGVNPEVAREMSHLAARARAELADDPERDLKLGIGGIREAEFFVQSLQLIWGGREPRVRGTNTLDALRRLRARGLVTDRETRELETAYLTLRRVEHRVQFATQVQTHTLPSGDLLETLARSLGFANGEALEQNISETRARVAARLGSLTREQTDPADATHADPRTAALERLYVALDAQDEAGTLAALSALAAGSATPATPAPLVSPELSRPFVALARRPDFPLGASTRDKHPELAPALVEAITDAADPEQAARLTGAFFARLATPGVYARAFAEEPRLLRRVVGLFGASAFLGEALVGHPELVDRMLFSRGVPDVASARSSVDEEIAESPEAHEDSEDDPAAPFVGALRRAKARVTMEVGLADLAGEIGTREATLALSELADATLARACELALRERGKTDGLSVIAMGKLGGREIGYGSDLDLIFVYEGTEDDAEPYVRAAQRVMRLVSMPHGDGAGYELDTRLRPSGSQGLLVVSRESFARYHEDSEGERRADDWERQALVKARPCAGDVTLGAKVQAICGRAAYEKGAPPAEKLHHMRARMERELAGERRDAEFPRYDLKLGRGGLVDVEFATQWLQMKCGKDPRVRSADTETALAALEACGYIDAQLATALREGYTFLRRLEQRLRVLHGTGAQLLEAGAPGLPPLARRMGMRDGPRGTAQEALLARYVAVTRDVRAAYLAVLDLHDDE